MKRKIWIFAIVILLAVLAVPIPTGTTKDGGTRTYTALTYKIVKWQRLLEDGSRYDRLRIYWVPDSFRSLDELWQMEKPEGDLRHLTFTDPWLNEDSVQSVSGMHSSDMIITKIYSNCFFAEPVLTLGDRTAKINGALSEKWCVGDQVLVKYENYRTADGKMEADLISVRESDFERDPAAAYKPVIYLYPQTETNVTVQLTLNGELTCAYPAYYEGWQVTASPDGTLTDAKGQTYNYLYWEGDINTRWDMTEGFCVKGEDTASFLEQALEKLGLNRREANEFIVYWLPLMEGNPFNIISFQTEAYTEAARLRVDPAPDTLIRVFMTWSSTNSFVSLPAQELSAPERSGFTVIEWGGAEVKS